MKTKLTLCIVVLLLQSCSNNDDNNTDQRTLPPITQTGENTFGCYIDQHLFLPRDGEGTFGSEDRAVYFISGYPELTSYYEFDVHDFKSERTADILIHVQSLDANGVGEYPINESNGLRGIDGLDHTYMHCRVWRDDVGNYQNYLSYENSGIINITKYNLSQRLVSGTFEGYVRNYHIPHDTIYISQGRFDFRWNTLDETEFP